MSHECSDCTFVVSAEDIYIDPMIRNYVSFRPLFIGSFSLVKWSSHAKFYAFKCRQCGLMAVDYLHGYTAGGRFFLSCNHCLEGDRPVIMVVEDRKILKAESLPLPPSFFEKLRLLYKFSVFCSRHRSRRFNIDIDSGAKLPRASSLR